MCPISLALGAMLVLHSVCMLALECSEDLNCWREEASTTRHGLSVACVCCMIIGIKSRRLTLWMTVSVRQLRSMCHRYRIRIWSVDLSWKAFRQFAEGHGFERSKNYQLSCFKLSSENVFEGGGLDGRIYCDCIVVSSI